MHSFYYLRFFLTMLQCLGMKLKFNSYKITAKTTLD